ncbi:hypothetical protein LCGC14_2570620 [marine sediment metagenome]|uniref:Phage ABA sandwich domain-containing protein n=1 Tax=marine sediment metagenome TaxID=412755 RepID=A0A0F9CTG8_9ZZZZ
MKEIKPGAELDYAVAEAIGWKHLDDKQIEGIPPGGAYLYIPIPRFSNNLNAAFAAADEVGLFTPQENDRGQGPWVSLHRGPLGWFVKSGETYIGRGRGDSPALAICAAILELKRP